ncbi:Uncharacterised protein [Bordetella pertussis]|nr:Uncharacterised protein [Bordetella pertussis]
MRPRLLAGQRAGHAACGAARITASGVLSGTSSWSEPVSTHSGSSCRSAGSRPSRPAISPAAKAARAVLGMPDDGAVKVHAPSCSRTGTTPALKPRRTDAPSPSNSLTTRAVPRAGWPAKRISASGVKTRTCASAPSPPGRMNVVSDRLNCRASACISSSRKPRASSNTHSGLPPKQDSANTLSRRKA